jgi:phosphonopyruvate decarboxylase
MIDIGQFSEILKNNSIEFISGVPDTLLNDFCLHVESNWPAEKHVVAANEGNAVAMAAGYYLATNTVPLVYMQNSGIGNAVNPLISLTHQSVYGIPMILLIGWRGEPGIKDHTQHTKQGELTPVLMNDLDIPWKKLTDDINGAEDIISWAVNDAKENSRPVAILVPKRVLEKGEKAGFEDQPDLMSREGVIHCIVDSLPKETIFVAATGRATRELFEVRRLRNESYEHDFLNVGAMGHTTSIASGIALANRNRLVVCLDGDASAIMHMGAMAVLGQIKQLGNLLHIVLNNGVHESVGGQKAASGNIDLFRIAEHAGYNSINPQILTEQSLSSALNKFILHNDGPKFIEVKIKKGMRKDLPPLKFDLKHHKDLIMNNFNQI